MKISALGKGSSKKIITLGAFNNIKTGILRHWKWLGSQALARAASQPQLTSSKRQKFGRKPNPAQCSRLQGHMEPLGEAAKTVTTDPGESKRSPVFLYEEKKLGGSCPGSAISLRGQLSSTKSVLPQAWHRSSSAPAHLERYMLCDHSLRWTSKSSEIHCSFACNCFISTLSLFPGILAFSLHFVL